MSTTTFTTVFTIEREEVEYDLTVEVSYNISKYRPATLVDPEEGRELEVESMNLLEVANLTDEGSVSFPVTDEFAATLLAVIDDEDISVACFENEEKVNEEDYGSLL